MASIPELLQAAEVSGRSGQLGQAAQLYQQVLQLDPGHAQALGQLGLIAFYGGQPDLAVEYLLRAAEAHPADADAPNTLGTVLRALGRPAPAEAAYREALRRRPGFTEAHIGLGSALREQGRSAEAEVQHREALRQRPDSAEAHNGLGSALFGRGRWAEAEAAYREALCLKPDFAEAHNNLGNALLRQDRPVEAEPEFRAALRLRPDYPEAHNNLGSALHEQARLVEAEAEYREALRLRPGYAEAHGTLGVIFHEKGRPAEAEAAYREALRLKPDVAEAHNNLAMLLLGQGRFDEGWAEYEWRFPAHNLGPRVPDRPVWDGAPLAGGQSLLLWAEQGMGDTLQFVRFAALAKERAGTVILECPPALIPLVSRCAGIDRLVGQGSPLPPFDAHAPLASLPRLLGTTLATIPAAVPYLTADPGLVRRWGQELASLPGYKVGIAWQGNPALGAYDRRRSFPLAALEPLARLPGVQLVVLQKGHGREQLSAAAGWPLTDLGGRLDEAGGAFEDTAAVMQSLDLVVSCDSALAHLAGALGRPAWVALPFAADWRWLHGREDSPWYPTLRLFRQTRPGDWGDVFQRMADTLRQLTG